MSCTLHVQVLLAVTAASILHLGLANCGAVAGVAGPIKALVQERQMDWQARFGQVLGLKVIQLTGDDDLLSLDDLELADVICSTPEKFGEHPED